METAVATPFLSLSIPSDAHVEHRENMLLITKWNWDYQDYLNFQQQAKELVQKNRKIKIFIFCNHPHVFTLGRGNERGHDELVTFSEQLVSILKYPVHKIHRGGGITFHYPGQWIFYPIVAINANYSLDDHMCWLLRSVKETLASTFGISDLLATKKLMGIWHNKRKLASIGVGVNRFVTEHGLALNLKHDSEMFTELKKISPCGMSSETYQSVDKVVGTQSEDMIKDFHESFIKIFI